MTRTNQSIGEFGSIFDVLGLTGSLDPVKMQQNMDARAETTAEVETQRIALRDAITFKKIRI